MQVAHIIRGISKGYIPSTSFLIVSLAATGTLLVGWRTALAATTPEVRCGVGGRGRVEEERHGASGALLRGSAPWEALCWDS